MSNKNERRNVLEFCLVKDANFCMHSLKLCGIVFIALLLFYCCDPCDNLDCAADNYYGQFRIVSANGEDLVFGEDKVYDKNKIRFYSMNGTDTNLLYYKTIYFPGTGYDSILQVGFDPEKDIAYMELNDNDTDTINITYNVYGTKCC